MRSQRQLIANALGAVRRGAYAETAQYCEKALRLGTSSDEAFAAHRVCGASLLVTGSDPERAAFHTEAALQALQRGPVGRDDFGDLVGTLNDAALARAAVGRVEDAQACLRRGLYAARRGFIPSPELARATLLHLAQLSPPEASNEAAVTCVQSAVDLLPDDWLESPDKPAVLWDAPCLFVTASTLALRSGDSSDAIYNAQLAVEAAALASTTDFAPRSRLLALAKGQRAACHLWFRKDRDCDDTTLAADIAALSNLAALPSPYRPAARAHLALALPAAAAQRKPLLASTDHVLADCVKSALATASSSAKSPVIEAISTNEILPHLGFEATVPGIGIMPSPTSQWWEELAVEAGAAASSAAPMNSLRAGSASNMSIPTAAA